MESIYGFVYYLIINTSFLLVFLWLFGMNSVIFPDRMWLHGIAAWILVLCLYILVFYWGYFLYYYKQSEEGRAPVGFHLDKTAFLAEDSD